MRVLVYGAGVLGCLLAHRLQTSGCADVTLLARGAWADVLERDGLTIRNILQRRTTTDRVRIIRELVPDDAYDLAFVVMQARQVPDVLPTLAAASAVRRVVFVGNNADAQGTAARLTELKARRPSGAGGVVSSPREIAFAFQSTGGRREAGRVISVYARLGMTLGGADVALRRVSPRGGGAACRCGLSRNARGPDGCLAQVPSCLHPAHRVCLLYVRLRPETLDKGPAPCHPRCLSRGICTASGPGHPDSPRRRRGVSGAGAPPPAPGSDGIRHGEDAARPPRRDGSLRPCRRRDARPHASLRTPARGPAGAR
ncbi:MAG: hypothetical protein KHY83_08130 [Coriobacteriia bacterium]|nr:hypothetical protein [Coriobacteriia bacterium]MBS5478616.1 hypothetical protein [Coriobacteriia bacterium]